MSEGNGHVVWRRPFDPEARGRRRRKLLLGYGLPFVLALAVGYAVGGTGALLGLAILLGLFGLLLVAWVELISHNERMNPEIRIDGDSLVVGRKRVRIADAEAWTTVMRKQTTSVGAPNTTSHRCTLARLRFRIPVVRDGERVTRPDGGPAFEVVGFAWPAMGADQLDGIRAALEPHLSAPYVPADRIRDA